MASDSAERAAPMALDPDQRAAQLNAPEAGITPASGQYIAINGV